MRLERLGRGKPGQILAGLTERRKIPEGQNPVKIMYDDAHVVDEDPRGESGRVAECARFAAPRIGRL
jgi:hypothetical protein